MSQKLKDYIADTVTDKVDKLISKLKDKSIDYETARMNILSIPNLDMVQLILIMLMR
jgi:translation initiation factor 2B subunit (eIF-2B alpha/beta/delta family)